MNESCRRGAGQAHPRRKPVSRGGYRRRIALRPLRLCLPLPPERTACSRCGSITPVSTGGYRSSSRGVQCGRKLRAGAREAPILFAFTFFVPTTKTNNGRSGKNTKNKKSQGKKRKIVSILEKSCREFSSPGGGSSECLYTAIILCCPAAGDGHRLVHPRRLRVGGGQGAL